MAVTVKIPTILRPVTGGRAIVEAAPGTLAEVLAELERRHAGLADRLFAGAELRRFVNVYVGGEDVRFSGGLATEVADGAHVTILPAVAGG